MFRLNSDSNLFTYFSHLSVDKLSSHSTITPSMYFMRGESDWSQISTWTRPYATWFLSCEIDCYIGESKVCPSHGAIASFRSENAKTLREVNKDFVKLCKDLGLFGARQVEAGGMFMKATANKMTIAQYASVGSLGGK